jgi:hypothetical protein
MSNASISNADSGFRFAVSIAAPPGAPPATPISFAMPSRKRPGPKLSGTTAVPRTTHAVAPAVGVTAGEATRPFAPNVEKTRSSPSSHDPAAPSTAATASPPTSARSSQPGSDIRADPFVIRNEREESLSSIVPRYLRMGPLISADVYGFGSLIALRISVLERWPCVPPAAAGRSFLRQDDSVSMTVRCGTVASKKTGSGIDRNPF